MRSFLGLNLLWQFCHTPILLLKGESKVVFALPFLMLSCYATDTSASPPVTFSPRWFSAHTSSVICVCPSRGSMLLMVPLQVRTSPGLTIAEKRTLMRARLGLPSSVPIQPLTYCP